jgi:tetratricopeptide (TPR) repeat protein
VKQQPALLSTICLALAAALCPLELAAQRAGADQEGESQASRATRQTPAISERVYQRLSEAQGCAEMDDYECALELLEELRNMQNLTDYERAQMWTFYGFVYFSQERTSDAINAYQRVLEQPELPLGVEQDTMMTLTQLYNAEERYQEALDMLNRWFAITASPGADQYYLMSVLYYQLEDYRAGIEPLLTAIRMNEEQGDPQEEGWWQLLNVLYFSLEDYENMIDTLSTMVGLWTKKDYVLQLASIYAQEGFEDRALALTHVAYEAGWLERNSEYVSVASMLLSADVPYQAAVILQSGLDSGIVDSTESNWRMTAQAWQLAQEDERALPAYQRASELAPDGDLDVRIAQSYVNLARWEDCIESARTALRRGGLSRPDTANMLLGNCLFELDRFTEAREAFREAARDERSRNAANQWINFVTSEETRNAQLRASLR